MTETATSQEAGQKDKEQTEVFCTFCGKKTPIILPPDMGNIIILGEVKTDCSECGGSVQLTLIRKPKRSR